MKVIVLKEETIIDGQLCRKGQVVQVSDSFSENISKVIVSTNEVKQNEDNLKQKIKFIKVEKEKIKKDK